MVKLRFDRQNILNALKRVNKSWKSRLATLITSSIVFMLLAFSTDIRWHLQTIQNGIPYWDDALLNSIISLSLGGSFTVTLSIIYALLTGAVLTSIGIQLLNRNIAFKGVGSVIPGFLATGCASCGLGLTGLFGFAGATALLPFNGDLLKILSIILLIYALHELGKSPVCRVNAE